MAAVTNGNGTANDADILKRRAQQIEAEANETIDFIHGNLLPYDNDL